TQKDHSHPPLGLGHWSFPSATPAKGEKACSIHWDFHLSAFLLPSRRSVSSPRAAGSSSAVIPFLGECRCGWRGARLCIVPSGEADQWELFQGAPGMRGHATTANCPFGRRPGKEGRNHRDSIRWLEPS